MSATTHDKRVRFARLNARPEKLHKERPRLFNLIALGIALALFGAVLLIEYFFKVI